MKNLRILLVEDDADDRNFFSFFLKDREDIKLLHPLDNGVAIISTLEDLSDNSNLPHLIILDQNMPVMTGLQTLQILKKNKFFSDIPVMLYSTYITPQLKKDSLQKGALEVIEKPNDKKGYYNMIDVFIQALNLQPS